jgi:flagellar biosynthetic protein FlhB
MSEQTGERTEQASGRRLEEAHRKGQVANSRDVSAAVSLLGTLAVAGLFGAQAVTILASGTRHWLATAASTSVTEATMPVILMRMGQDVLILAVPFGLILLALGAGSHILQSGWVWSTERLEWDPSRMSPIAGLKRMVSLRSVVEMAKAFLKILVIGAAVYWSVKDEVETLPLMLQMQPEQALFRAGRLAFSATAWVAGVVLMIAAVDYAFQWWQHRRDLRMTRDEVKRELRDTEGDPLIRSRIRTLQRQAARRRMMQEVPKSDVVITNPTHLAVALRYDGTKMSAPVVVAKGAGFIAERIREVAQKHGIPIIENKPLARSLHKLVDLGREIPEQLYQAVAEILALVLRARKRI